MRKALKMLKLFLIGTSVLALSATPAFAQNKLDPRVVKECEAINNTYEYLNHSLIIGLPLDVPNRDKAQKELNDLNASHDIILECGAISYKSWQSIKNDYAKVVKAANKSMKTIILKYKLRQEITITCIKGGLKKDITSLDPKCPKGYKKLY